MRYGSGRGLGEGITGRGGSSKAGPRRGTAAREDQGMWHGKNTQAWKRLSRMVLVRDGYVCQLRLPGCKGRATSADHIVPVALGGSDHPSNLRASCVPCNSRAGGALGSKRGRLGPASRGWL